MLFWFWVGTLFFGGYLVAQGVGFGRFLAGLASLMIILSLFTNGSGIENSGIDCGFDAAGNLVGSEC